MIDNHPIEELKRWRKRIKDRPWNAFYRNFFKALEEALEDIIEELESEQPSPTGTPAAIRLYRGDITIQGGSTPMPITIKDSEQVQYAIAEVDSKGFPVPSTGTATTTVSDPAILSVDATDPFNPVVKGVAPGSAQVAVSVDLGDGSAPLTGTDDVTVSAGAAASLTLTPGTPAPQA